MVRHEKVRQRQAQLRSARAQTAEEAIHARGEGPPWSGAGKWTRYERGAVLTWLTNVPRENNSSPSEMEASEQKPAGTKVLAELASTLEARP
jgi:hypothetical protein